MRFLLVLVAAVMMIMSGVAAAGQYATLNQTTDGLSLLTFKGVLEAAGTPSTLFTSWSGKTPCQSAWAHVKCNVTLLRVTNLDLRNLGVTGTISSALGNLDEMQYLWLFGNMLYGTIPKALCALTNLNTLDLATNTLTGTIPTCIGALAANLRYLYLQANGLVGTLPSSLGLLTGLRMLNVNSNSLTGIVPATVWSNDTALHHLDVSGNFFSGTIPTSIANLSSLQYLDISIQQGWVSSKKQFYATIPSEIGLLTNLSYVSVAGNTLTATIPTEIGRLSLLLTLLLYANAFSGALPSEMGLLGRLSYLDVDSNMLEVHRAGATWAWWGNMSSLAYADFHQNRFTGPIPAVLLSGSSSAALSYLDLSHNAFTGNVDVLAPSSWAGAGAGAALTYLDMSYNALNGTLPPQLASVLCSNLLVLHVQYNSLAGEIPPLLFSSPGGGLAVLQELDMSYNLLSGDVAAVQWRYLANVTLVNLHGNKLMGSIPSEIFRLTALASLDVGSNLLVGTISTEIGLLAPSLWFLDVSSNALSGSLPGSFGSVNFVTALLNDNLFTGSLPAFTTPANASLMSQLHMQDNAFSGSLPAGFGSFTQISELVLFNNFFTATLPPGMGAYTALQTFFVQNNNFSGSLPASWVYLASNATLTKMDISNSGLSCPFCTFQYLVYQGLPNAIQIAQQPPSSYDNAGTFPRSQTPMAVSMLDCSSVICAVYGCGGYDCAVVPFPSVVVTAVVTPADLVQPNSLHGNVVQSTQGVAVFNGFGFVGIPNTSYTIVFQSPVLKPYEAMNFEANGLVISFGTIASATVFIPPCEALIANSVGDATDPYNCVCDQGFYKIASVNACVACPVGTFKNTSSSAADSLGVGACTSCAPFKITAAPASTSVVDCVCLPSFVHSAADDECYCGAGMYLLATSLTSQQVCLECPVNTFATTLNRNLSCVACASIDGNTWTNSLVGQNRSAACECSTGMVSHPATSLCTCAPGYVFQGATEVVKCNACPANTFASGYELEKTCEPCPDGRVTAAGLMAQANLSSCLCPQGSFPTTASEGCIACTILPAASVDCVGESPSATTAPGLASYGLQPHPGWWLTTDAQFLPHNAATTPFLLVPCPYQQACPGYSANASIVQVCATGYTGPACGLCQDSYGRLGKQCQACPSPAASKFLAFLVIFLIVIAAAALVYYTLRTIRKEGKEEEDKASSTTTMRLKIALTHLQVLGFTLNFREEWPAVILRVFQIPTSASTISVVNNIAFDCAATPSLYSRAIFTFLLPVILCVGVSCVFLSLRQLGRFSEYSLREMTVPMTQACVCLLYIAHPGIFQSILTTLQCYTVGTQQLALADMSVNCSSASYIALRIVAILYLILYGIGALVAIFVLLRRDKIAFVFLSAGLDSAFYYWDITIMIRKLFLVTVSVFATPSLQIFLGIWILYTSHLLHLRASPYVSPVANMCESLSLITLLLTITVGMLLYIGVFTADAAYAVAVVLILLNFGTLAFVVFAEFFVHLGLRGKKNAGATGVGAGVQMSSLQK